MMIKAIYSEDKETYQMSILEEEMGRRREENKREDKSREK